MGAAKNKRNRFLEAHPICCFCGGHTAAATIDHIPARTCFKGRAFPETFEFPACHPCNSASRLDEIAFSFYVRMMDLTGANTEPDEANKLITGLVNNAPHLVPTRPTANEIRHSLQRMGLPRPNHAVLTDLPIVNIPQEAHAYFERYARKIVIALHYREKKRVPSLDHKITMEWGSQTDRTYRDRVEGFLAFPNVEIGTRTNVKFGDQFSYRYVAADDPDVFAAIVHFGTGMSVAGMVVDPNTASKLLADGLKMGLPIDHDPWISVRDNYPDLEL